MTIRKIKTRVTFQVSTYCHCLRCCFCDSDQGARAVVAPPPQTNSTPAFQMCGMQAEHHFSQEAVNRGLFQRAIDCFFSWMLNWARLLHHIKDLHTAFIRGPLRKRWSALCWTRLLSVANLHAGIKRRSPRLQEPFEENTRGVPLLVCSGAELLICGYNFGGGSWGGGDVLGKYWPPERWKTGRGGAEGMEI